MIEVMLQVHMTEAEAARDFHAVLERVREGAEVVIEQDRRPVAVIRTTAVKGRLLSECIALAEARGSTVTPDEGLHARRGRRDCKPQRAMESAVLGVIIDSSVAIDAERDHLDVAGFLRRIAGTLGEREGALCAVTVAELAHGIYRARHSGAARPAAPVP